ncbi:MAG: response regulator [Planctomycetaceae bacterium]
MSPTPLILVAEDNRVLADVIRFNLDVAGFDVEMAHNGLVALSMAEEREFDLIISDYQMPGCSGEELLEQIRHGHGASRFAAAILCSAKGYELNADELAQSLGIDRIVLKPFSPSELVTAARETIGRRSAAAKPAALPAGVAHV